MLYILSSIMSGLAALASYFILMGQPTAGTQQAAEAAITRADEAFCAAVADGRVESFRELIAEDAVFNAGTPGALRGRDAVVKGWAPFFAAGGPRLTWKPAKAEVLPVGDVGYTVGTWERHVPGPGGQVAVAHGHYMTVWRKQPDGVWRVVFDSGGEDPR